ncbi:response regulator, partial [Acinetobacter baumannii]
MKALIVDDDPVSRLAMVDLVSSFPELEIVEANSGERAWALIQASIVPPVLCCCDIQMLEMSGTELVKRA